jgi:hypothetical protein
MCVTSPPSKYHIPVSCSQVKTKSTFACFARLSLCWEKTEVAAGRLASFVGVDPTNWPKGFLVLIKYSGVNKLSRSLGMFE